MWKPSIYQWRSLWQKSDVRNMGNIYQCVFGYSVFDKITFESSARIIDLRFPMLLVFHSQIPYTPHWWIYNTHELINLSHCRMHSSLDYFSDNNSDVGWKFEWQICPPLQLLQEWQWNFYWCTVHVISEEWSEIGSQLISDTIDDRIWQSKFTWS